MKRSRLFGIAVLAACVTVAGYSFADDDKKGDDGDRRGPRGRRPSAGRSDEGPARGGPRGSRPSAADIFKRMDADGDGSVTREEFEEAHKKMRERMGQRGGPPGRPSWGGPGRSGPGRKGPSARDGERSSRHADGSHHSRGRSMHRGHHSRGHGMHRGHHGRSHGSWRHRGRGGDSRSAKDSDGDRGRHHGHRDHHHGHGDPKGGDKDGGKGKEKGKEKEKTKKTSEADVT